MSYDGVATAAAVSELQQNLTLGKIEKIYQPHSEQLIFNIHTKAGRKKLLLSVSGNHAGAYLTETVPENPAAPCPRRRTRSPGGPGGTAPRRCPTAQRGYLRPAARKRPYYRDPAGNRQ